MRGCFILNPNLPNEKLFPNTIVDDGAEAFLRQLFQSVSLPSFFYVGLTNATYTYADADLASIAAGEPNGNGYLRQAAPRNTTWDVSLVSTLWRARSPTLTFVASSNWDKTWRRMFLTDAASGTVGKVYALSGPTDDDQIVITGEGPTVAYEFWPRV